MCCIQEVTNQWEEFVEDHLVYQNSYSHCLEWVATLRKRLQVCADLAGDKQDVEDRLIKLQVNCVTLLVSVPSANQTVQS